MWADWLHHPYCLGGPECFKVGDKIRGGPTCGRIGYIIHAVSGGAKCFKAGDKNNRRAHMWADWLHHPCCLGGPHCFRAGNKIRRGPTCGRIGYITLAVSGVPNFLGRGTKSEVGPCCLGGPQRSKAGDNVISGPACEQIGYINPPVSGIPQLESGGQNEKWAHMREVWLHHPCYLRDPHYLRVGDKIGASSSVQSRGQRHKWARMWADWLHHPYCLGGPQRSKAGGKIRCEPTCGQIGCITLAVSRVPKASKRGTKSEQGPHVGRLAASPLLSRGSPLLQSGGQNQNRAHMREVWWLHHSCCLGGPQRFKAGDKIRIGPTCGRIGYITPAVSGVPNA